MRNWALSLFAICLMAVPAMATPPQIVWVTDRLFAITDREVLILRTIEDNHGYYQTTQTDTFIVIRDLATGRDISHSTVERVVAHGEGLAPTHHPLEGSYNPYGIRATMNAAPLSDPRRMYLDVAVVDGAVRATDHDGVTHSARWSDLIPMTAVSLQRTRDILPILKQEGDGDLFDPFGILQPAACEVTGAVRSIYLSDVDSMLVQLTCEDEDVGASNVIWVTLPAV